MEKNIAVIWGDCSSPEIVKQTIRVLDKVAEKYGHTFHYTDAAMGGEAIDKYGDPLPQHELDKCLAADSVLLGAVGGAVGHGILNVIKDMGMKEPYVGQCVLQTSEIAEDLTYYFATSEQVPSSVGLGVLMNKDNTVRQAGGFIIQLMPFCDEKVIEKLEQRLAEVNSVTAFLDEGLTPEQILEKLLGDMDLVINDTVPTQFYCNCSRERVSKALIAVGRKELNEMIQEAKPVELKCHFCNSAYEFSTEDLKELLRKSK